MVIFWDKLAIRSRCLVQNDPKVELTSRTGLAEIQFTFYSKQDRRKKKFVTVLKKCSMSTKVCRNKYSLVHKKVTVLLSTNLAWPALAWCSWAELLSQPGTNSFAQPCRLGN